MTTCTEVKAASDYFHNFLKRQLFYQDIHQSFCSVEFKQIGENVQVKDYLCHITIDKQSSSEGLIYLLVPESVQAFIVCQINK